MQYKLIKKPVFLSHKSKPLNVVVVVLICLMSAMNASAVSLRDDACDTLDILLSIDDVPDTMYMFIKHKAWVLVIKVNRKLQLMIHTHTHTLSQ